MKKQNVGDVEKKEKHKKDLCSNCYDIVFVKKIDIHQILNKQ